MSEKPQLEADAYRLGVKQHDGGIAYLDCPAKLTGENVSAWKQGWRDAEQRDRLDPRYRALYGRAAYGCVTALQKGQP